MNKEYILMDLDKLKFITEGLITDVAWPYKLKKIEDLTLSNLFKLNIFVSENKEDCEWYVKNFKISDNLDLQIFDLEEGFKFIKNHLFNKFSNRLGLLFFINCSKID